MRYIAILVAAFIAFNSAAACDKSGSCVRLDDGTDAPLPLNAVTPIPAYSNVCNNTNGTTVPSVCTNAQGYKLLLTDQSGQSIGASLYLQAQSDWAVFQTWLNYNPTEFQIYSSAAIGKVTTNGGDNNVYLDSGSHFQSEWVGRNFFYLNGVQYKVASYTSSSQIRLSNIDGSAVVLPVMSKVDYHWVSTSTDSICNVDGTSVTYVSGQLFNGGMAGGAGGLFTINGVRYTIAKYNSTKSVTLFSSAGTLKNAKCHADHNIYDEVATFRVQKVLGKNEENLSITARAVADGPYPGQYRIQSQIAGSGVYLPIIIGSGSNGKDLNRNVVVQPTGNVDLGGDSGVGTQVLTVQGSGTKNTNLIYAGVATAGNNVYLSSRSNTDDNNVGFTIDTLGAGQFIVTNHTFGSTGFAVNGSSAGGDYVAVGNGTDDAMAGPYLTSTGSDANVNLRLLPKGTGAVLVGGHFAGSGGAPTLSSCGTSPALSAGANDIHGTITTGTGVLTSCTLNFNQPHTNIPDCSVTPLAGGPIPAYTPSTTTLIVTTSSSYT